jgi:hypothetical protein
MSYTTLPVLKAEASEFSYSKSKDTIIIIPLPITPLPFIFTSKESKRPAQIVRCQERHLQPHKPHTDQAAPH